MVDIWWNGVGVVHSGENRTHPTQKPVALYEWLLSKYAKPNDKIIDTHGGSGSIAIAVDKANTLDKTNYSLDIIELDKDYFDASLNRFKQYKSQTTLF
jgi:site-specific DNA-methyltransferase (adenine-specific)